MCGCTLPWLAVQCCPSPLSRKVLPERDSFCLTFSLSFPLWLSPPLLSTLNAASSVCFSLSSPHLSLTPQPDPLCSSTIFPRHWPFLCSLNMRLLLSWCLVFNTPPILHSSFSHIFHHLSCAQLSPPQSSRPSPPQLTQSLSAHDECYILCVLQAALQLFYAVIYCLSFS